MNKFISIFVIFFVIFGGYVLLDQLYVFKGSTSAVFYDGSVIIEGQGSKDQSYSFYSSSIKTTGPLPSVECPGMSLQQAISEARIARMRERRRKAAELVAELSGISRPTAMVVNISKFGGPKDTGVTYKETGSVDRRRLKTAKPEDEFIAWFMPSMNQDNLDSPIKVPSVESLLGGDGKTLKEQIELANQKLKGCVAEITSLDENGNILAGPFEFPVADRGPNPKFENPRMDASLPVWKKLKVDWALKKPNADDHRVNLVIRLLPKAKSDESSLLTLENATKWYGPQVEVADEDAESYSQEIQFSKSGGEKFQLPSWDREENNSTVASNP